MLKIYFQMLILLVFIVIYQIAVNFIEFTKKSIDVILQIYIYYYDVVEIDLSSVGS